MGHLQMSNPTNFSLQMPSPEYKGVQKDVLSQIDQLQSKYASYRLS